MYGATLCMPVPILRGKPDLRKTLMKYTLDTLVAHPALMAEALHFMNVIDPVQKKKRVFVDTFWDI
eukprot:4045426-Amphidinium_carterae.1